MQTDTRTNEANPIDAVIDLAEHLGVRGIAKRPGCWEERIDATWWVALNPHLENVACSTGAVVPSGHLYVTYNGWPAGIVSLTGDGEFAAGDGANPETFVAAVRARIAEGEGNA